RAASHAFDQRRAQILLDETNAAADRRLRPVEPAGCTGEAAELGDRDEGADLVDVHCGPFIRKTDGLRLYYALDKSTQRSDPCSPQRDREDIPCASRRRRRRPFGHCTSARAPS